MNQNPIPHSFVHLTEFLSTLTQPFLLVLDQFYSLPFSHDPLNTLMRKHNAHIVITTHISSTPNRIADDTHKVLNRGISLQELKPLQFLSSMQRLVYNLMKNFDLVPMNNEQMIIEEIETCTCGHPALIDITNAVLRNFIDDGDCSKGLQKFYDEVITPTLAECKAAFAKDELRASEKKQTQKTNDVQVPSNIINLSTHSVLDDLYCHSNPAIIYTQVVLKYIKLNHLQYTLLCSLAILNSVPVHAIVIDTLESMLKRLSNVQVEMDIQELLKTYKLLVQYPHPVIKVPDHVSKPTTISNTDEYFIVPPVICESLKSILSAKDKAMLPSIMYYMLDDMSSEEHSDVPSFIVLHCIALRQLLLDLVFKEYKLYSKDVFQTVVEKYFNEKIEVKGKDGLVEIIVDNKI